MTREYHIDQAFKDYILKTLESPLDKKLVEDLRKTFYAGVKAADKYPILTWKEADVDLPCWNSEFLVTLRMTTNVLVVIKDTRDNHLFVSTSSMVKSDNWNWTINCDEYKVIYWMPIPKIA